MLDRRRAQIVPSRLPNLSPTWVGDALEPNETTGMSLAWMVRSCLAIDPIARPQSATLARFASAFGVSSHPREEGHDMAADPVMPASIPTQIPWREESIQENMSLDAILHSTPVATRPHGSSSSSSHGRVTGQLIAQRRHGYQADMRVAQIDDDEVTPPAELPTL